MPQPGSCPFPFVDPPRCSTTVAEHLGGSYVAFHALTLGSALLALVLALVHLVRLWAAGEAPQSVKQLAAAGWQLKSNVLIGLEVAAASVLLVANGADFHGYRNTISLMGSQHLQTIALTIANLSIIDLVMAFVLILKANMASQSLTELSDREIARARGAKCALVGVMVVVLGLDAAAPHLSGIGVILYAGVVAVLSTALSVMVIRGTGLMMTTAARMASLSRQGVLSRPEEYAKLLFSKAQALRGVVVGSDLIVLSLASFLIVRVALVVSSSGSIYAHPRRASELFTDPFWYIHWAIVMACVVQTGVFWTRYGEPAGARVSAKADGPGSASVSKGRTVSGAAGFGRSGTEESLRTREEVLPA
eukprot:TRINITY_DN1747_c2_g1_i1.p1 TRINITY_DN1747_c2_g1~~TRINITY_DN1747_c2_g1_i1.p1  ORF type:complete len:363 (-),score=90.63 TRINITY_DN1747_c2_g1_i1:33-1121(-)